MSWPPSSPVRPPNAAGKCSVHHEANELADGTGEEERGAPGTRPIQYQSHRGDAQNAWKCSEGVAQTQQCASVLQSHTDESAPGLARVIKPTGSLAAVCNDHSQTAKVLLV